MLACLRRDGLQEVCRVGQARWLTVARETQSLGAQQRGRGRGVSLGEGANNRIGRVGGLGRGVSGKGIKKDKHCRVG